MSYDTYSEAYRNGKRDGRYAYSDYDYHRENYDRHGSEAQRNYAGGFDRAREDKRFDDHRREAVQEREDAVQRQMEQEARYRHEQEEQEQELREQQMCEDQQDEEVQQ